MKKHPHPTRRPLSATWILAACVVAAVCNPAPALGADRVVLCEEFSNTG